MTLIPFNDWCNEDDYMCEMAKMHKITPKLDVIRTLHTEFKKLKNQQNLTVDQKWLLVELSGQIVALSMELTDDLAFTCGAYLKSLANHNKKVVKYIANFERKDAQNFYENVSKNEDDAARALGLSTAEITMESKEKYKNTFGEILKLRNHFWRWYNGYKHGQYATPVAVGVDTPQEKWGWYLIPRKFKTCGGRVHTEGEKRFIDTVRFVDEFVRLAEASVELWLETVTRQFPKVFS